MCVQERQLSLSLMFKRVFAPSQDSSLCRMNKVSVVIALVQD